MLAYLVISKERIDYHPDRAGLGGHVILVYWRPVTHGTGLRSFAEHKSDESVNDRVIPQRVEYQDASSDMILFVGTCLSWRDCRYRWVDAQYNPQSLPFPYYPSRRQAHETDHRQRHLVVELVGQTGMAQGRFVVQPQLAGSDGNTVTVLVANEDCVLKGQHRCARTFLIMRRPFDVAHIQGQLRSTRHCHRFIQGHLDRDGLSQVIGIPHFGC